MKGAISVKKENDIKKAAKPIGFAAFLESGE
jgi:hypothetical protein